MRQFFRFFGGVLTHPRSTFDALAAEPTVRWGVAAAFALFFAALFLYILLIEEKELAARFGPEYLEYKRRTAFIIPGV